MAISKKFKDPNPLKSISASCHDAPCDKIEFSFDNVAKHLCPVRIAEGHAYRTVILTKEDAAEIGAALIAWSKS